MSVCVSMFVYFLYVFSTTSVHLPFNYCFSSYFFLVPYIVRSCVHNSTVWLQNMYISIIDKSLLHAIMHTFSVLEWNLADLTDDLLSESFNAAFCILNIFVRCQFGSFSIFFFSFKSNAKNTSK